MSVHTVLKENKIKELFTVMNKLQIDTNCTKNIEVMSRYQKNNLTYKIQNAEVIQTREWVLYFLSNLSKTMTLQIIMIQSLFLSNNNSLPHPIMVRMPENCWEKLQPLKIKCIILCLIKMAKKEFLQSKVILVKQYQQI